MKGIYNFKSLSSTNELVGKINKGAAQSALIRNSFRSAARVGYFCAASCFRFSF
ncbi:MAG: hypothetical protein ACMUJM_15025 [bacterium]